MMPSERCTSSREVLVTLSRNFLGCFESRSFFVEITNRIISRRSDPSFYFNDFVCLIYILKTLIVYLYFKDFDCLNLAAVSQRS